MSSLPPRCYLHSLEFLWIHDSLEKFCQGIGRSWRSILVVLLVKIFHFNLHYCALFATKPRDFILPTLQGMGGITVGGEALRTFCSSLVSCAPASSSQPLPMGTCPDGSSRSLKIHFWGGWDAFPECFLSTPCSHPRQGHTKAPSLPSSLTLCSASHINGAFPTPL